MQKRKSIPTYPRQFRKYNLNQAEIIFIYMILSTSNKQLMQVVAMHVMCATYSTALGQVLVQYVMLLLLLGLGHRTRLRIMHG